MTLRMPPWEAERVANVLEYARMLTATEPKMKPWMKACAARIKVTPEVLSNIHRYGYEGSKQYVLSDIESPYWKKVKKEYGKMKKENT